MNFIRSRFRRGVWVALWATLGLAFAPTVSRMVLPSQDHCASWGVGHDMAAMASTMPMSPPVDDAGQTAAHAHGPSHAPATLEHCDLCAVAALACAVTPPTLPLDTALASHATPAGRHDISSERRTERSPATWRGPPATA